MNKLPAFLHVDTNTKFGTIRFSLDTIFPEKEMIRVQVQNSRDPDEELDFDVVTKEEARKVWKEWIANGAKKAQDWHPCKSRSAWHHDSTY